MALASASFKIEMNAKRSGPLILASHPPASAKTRKDRIKPRFLSPANFSTALLELVTAPTIDQLVCSG
jgi:hypothetical protein